MYVLLANARVTHSLIEQSRNYVIFIFNTYIVYKCVPELFDPLNQSSAAGTGGADKGGSGSTSVLEAKQEDGLEGYDQTVGEKSQPVIGREHHC